MADITDATLTPEDEDIVIATLEFNGSLADAAAETAWRNGDYRSANACWTAAWSYRREARQLRERLLKARFLGGPAQKTGPVP